MLLLLPPSEGKSSPAAGAPVDLASLAHPELAEARRRVGDTLARVSGQRNALGILGAGPSLADDVRRNTLLWESPAAPAAHVYSGVLYDAADAASWTGALLDRAAARVRVVSALWGLLSPADAIPAYRLSMGTTLPRLGPLAAFWRPRLAPVLDDFADGRLVVDCRSSGYGAVWPGRGRDVLAVRVLREADGRRAVVSHMAKHTRGLLAGALVRADASPRTARDVADAARALLADALADVALEATPGSPGGTLTLVLRGG